MFISALLAFLLLPGIFAGLIPALIIYYDHDPFPEMNGGWFILVVGVLLLLLCVRDFWIVGRGTLAPWNPPQQLVRVGLYRFVRNPMYIAVIIIISGWVISSGSFNLVIYGMFMATIFHLRVVYGEEPEMVKQFDSQWTQYENSVPRWLPQITGIRNIRSLAINKSRENNR